MAQLQFESGERLNHAYILSAPDRAEAVAAAKNLAAAAVCSGEGKVPCGKCRSCRKVFDGIHPDVISVRRPADDKGRAKKEITVDQIRAVTADSVIMPNEAARKVYIIEDADLMNPQAQNAALKLLEEPPAGVIFLLCAENAQLLLPTVRSRCAELIVSGAEKAADSEGMKLAKDYFAAVAAGSADKLAAFCFKNEGMDSRAAAAFIDSAITLDADMLCRRCDRKGLSDKALMHCYELLRRCEGYLKVNTGVKHIFGLLMVDSLCHAAPDRKDK